MMISLSNKYFFEDKYCLRTQEQWLFEIQINVIASLSYIVNQPKTKTQ